MTPQVRHCPVAERPPAIPFRSRNVDVVERPIWGRAQPEVPVQSDRNWFDLLGTFADGNDIAVLAGFFVALPAPGARDPHVSFPYGADRVRLNQLDDATVVVHRM